MIMNRIVTELKHAFAVDAVPVELREGLPEPLERLANAVVDRGMEMPATILLETIRPLGFLANQGLIAAWPLAKFTAMQEDYRQIAEALEDRRTLGNLGLRIEELVERRKASA